jgi:hypothetical protein
LRLPVFSVVIAAVVLFALFCLVADRARGNGAIFVPPFAILWFMSCVVILVRVHRAAHSGNSVWQFAAPVLAALAFLVGTAYAGEALASLLSTTSFPHQRVLP